MKRRRNRTLLTQGAEPLCPVTQAHAEGQLSHDSLCRVSETGSPTATASEMGSPPATVSETGSPTATASETGSPAATASEMGSPAATASGRNAAAGWGAGSESDRVTAAGLLPGVIQGVVMAARHCERH